MQSLQHKCELLHNALVALRQAEEMLNGLCLLMKTRDSIQDECGGIEGADEIRRTVCLSRLRTCETLARDILERARESSILVSHSFFII